MKFKLILFFLALQGSVFAQKLKEKKDIVYLDDVPQYKLEKTDGSLLKGMSFAAMTVDGKDTLIKFQHQSVKVPSLPHESSIFFRSYAFAQFVEADTTFAITYQFKKNLMEFIQEHQLIKDGKVTKAGVETIAKIAQDYAPRITESDSIILRRQELSKNPKYKDYSETLVKRASGGEKLSVTEGKISVEVPLEAPIVLGSYKENSDNDYGVTYFVYKKDGNTAGIIFYEKGRKRLFYRSLFDNKGRETFGAELDKNKILQDGVKYFVQYGYL